MHSGESSVTDDELISHIDKIQNMVQLTVPANILRNLEHQLIYDRIVKVCTHECQGLYARMSMFVRTNVKVYSDVKDDDRFPYKPTTFFKFSQLYSIDIGTNDIQNIYDIQRTISIFGTKRVDLCKS